jgi:exodeoxyribonuclease-5
MAVTLTDHQFSAVKEVAEWYQEANRRRSDFERRSFGSNHLTNGQSFTFCGYAGSGKSTCVAAMIEKLGLKPEEVGFMAPTGKAAKVLSDKLRADGWDRGATTIHSAIYTPKRQRADAIQHKIEQLEAHLEWRIETAFNDDYADRLPDGSPGYNMSAQEITKKLDRLDSDLEAALDELQHSDGPSFALKHPDQLDSDIRLFCVDETSMVDMDLATDLASFGKPVLAIGDPGQLPPVAGKWGFNLENPDVFLTEIHRQAADNPIIHLATMAREGKELEIGDYGDGVRVISRRDDNVTLDMDREAMVLCGTHKTRWRLTKKIREALGITETGPMMDEPLLIVKNSQKYPSLVNGSIVRCGTDIGVLQKGNARLEMTIFDDDANGVQYDLEGAQAIFEEHMYRKQNAYSAPPKLAFAAKKQCEQIDFGHVLTVHKSQGSEWDNVVLHDESGVFRGEGQRWLYTGVTRAAKELTVVVT